MLTGLNIEVFLGRFNTFLAGYADMFALLTAIDYTDVNILENKNDSRCLSSKFTYFFTGLRLININTNLKIINANYLLDLLCTPSDYSSQYEPWFQKE